MSETAEATKNDKICEICNNIPSKYCCPRCNILYCSLDCYKAEKHMECSENFYRDCVNEELSSHHADDESQRKMIEILKRMHDEDLHDIQIDDSYENDSQDSDDNDEIDLHDRIKGINLNDADAVWEALTEDERNEFEALLQGEVGSIIPQWDPWWMYNKEKKMVEEVIEKDKVEEQALLSCPTIVEVPKFSTLTSVKPSPAIKFNITNVLASYAFVSRYFNGELDPDEAAVYFLNTSANLDSNANFDDEAIAVESVAQKCLQSDLIQTDKESLDVMKNDVFHIIQGPCAENKAFYCKAALSHMHTIFTGVKIASKQPKSNENKSTFFKKFPEHGKEHLPNLDKSKVKKCIKKLEYYISFINEYSYI